MKNFRHIWRQRSPQKMSFFSPGTFAPATGTAVAARIPAASNVEKAIAASDCDVFAPSSGQHLLPSSTRVLLAFRLALGRQDSQASQEHHRLWTMDISVDFRGLRLSVSGQQNPTASESVSTPRSSESFIAHKTLPTYVANSISCQTRFLYLPRRIRISTACASPSFETPIHLHDSIVSFAAQTQCLFRMRKTQVSRTSRPLDGADKGILLRRQLR